MPVFTMPQLQPAAALVGVALPLFVVTMASQNLPGVAAQRAAGYAVPVSPVIDHHRPGDAAAGTVRRLCAEPGGHHRGHLHGARSQRGPGAALHRAVMAGVFYIVAWGWPAARWWG
jgi:benzoate membrane transport protein